MFPDLRREGEENEKMMISFAVDGAVKSEGYPSMAYHNNQLSQKFPLHHLSGHRGHLEEGGEEDASAILSILPDYNPHRLPHSTSTDPLPKSQDHRQHPSPPADTGPTWLGSSISRQQGQYADVDFLNLSRVSEPAAEGAPHPSGQWLSWSILHRNASDVGDEEATVSAESMIAAAGTLGHESTDVRNHYGSSNEIRINESVTIATHPNIVHNTGMEREDDGGGEPAVDMQNAKFKADILAHPLYEPLLSVHVTCLRISTPVDQLPRIDAQLEQAQQVVAKYSDLSNGDQLLVDDEKELDQFMMQYALLLSSFKEQLQKHVRVHAMEAVTACWEIEQSLQCLMGVSSGEGTGATMSDDDDGKVGNDTIWFDGGLEGADSTGFGPLNPTKSERSLMERVRHELKHELKQGYKDKIQDMREEILRKRRAGKLPGDTTCVLKSWWQLHSKWPYPTEEDKARLVQETGLRLKQINNWFINQRKRNWHSSSSFLTASKTKRKSHSNKGT